MWSAVDSPAGLKSCIPFIPIVLISLLVRIICLCLQHGGIIAFIFPFRSQLPGSMLTVPMPLNESLKGNVLYYYSTTETCRSLKRFHFGLVCRLDFTRIHSCSSANRYSIYYIICCGFFTAFRAIYNTHVFSYSVLPFVILFFRKL